MQSGGALGTEKKDGETFLEEIGGRIAYRMEGRRNLIYNVHPITDWLLSSAAKRLQIRFRTDLDLAERMRKLQEAVSQFATL